MQTLTKVAISSTAVAAVIGALLVHYLWSSPVTRSESAPSKGSIATLGLGVDSAASSPSPEVPGRGHNRAKPADLRRKDPIYSQVSLYPFLMRMHGAKAPGTWASGMQMLRACALAASMAPPSSLLAGSVNDTNYNVRREAWEKIESRCSGQPLGQYIDQYAPLADDEFGKQYEMAKRALREQALFNGENISRALNEFSRQGKLEEAEPLIKRAQRWNGSAWKGDPADFSRVVDAAIELATAEYGSERNDIRLLARCYRYDRCDYRYGQLAELANEGERYQYEIIARQMAASIVAGDVSRTLGGKAQ